MKCLVLSTAAAAFLASAPGHAAVVSVGSGLARSCYEAANARDATIENHQVCDRALTEEALIDSDRAATFVNRGVLSMIGRRMPSAIADMDAAIAINPAEPEAWLDKGVLMLWGGRYRESIDLVEKSLALRTREPAMAHLVRGMARELTGDVRGAYADYREAQALKPGWAAPTAELARFQVR